MGKLSIRKGNYMNKIIVSGYLGADPENKTTKSGKPATTISLGHQRKDANGQKTTDWFDCIAYGKNGELIAQYCHKGDELEVVGKLQTRSWQDQTTGQTRKMYIVLVDEFEFRKRKQDAAPSDMPFET